MSVDRETLTAARRWLEEGRPAALVVLAEVEGSAPFEVGAMMLIDGEGHVEGSVTGGCVESALATEAAEVLAEGRPRMRTYGISDELATEVGLMCGGTVHILIAPLSGGDDDAQEALEAALGSAVEGRESALATLLDGESAGARIALAGGRAIGSLGAGELLDKNVQRELGGLLEQGTSAVRRYAADGATMGSELRVLVQAFAEPPELVIVGAIDYSAALAALARELGYRVYIVDPRAPFLSSERFERVARPVVEWPDRFLEARQLGARDAVLVFSHDPKLDEPALLAALRSGAGYVGALGSRRTHADRVRRLREAGASEQEVGRIAAPCGLDIGARTPTETAISVLAEMIALRHERSGSRLVESDGPIHARSGGTG